MIKSDVKKFLLDFCDTVGCHCSPEVLKSYLDYPNPLIKFDDMTKCPHCKNVSASTYVDVIRTTDVQNPVYNLYCDDCEKYVYGVPKTTICPNCKTNNLVISKYGDLTCKSIGCGYFYCNQTPQHP